jgi:RND family efflux transporter MFP subunit
VTQVTPGYESFQIYNYKMWLEMQSYSSTRRCVCVSTLILLGALGLGGCTAGDAPGKAPDRRDRSKEIQVTAVPVQAKQIRRNVDAVGSLFPQEEVTVSSEVDGKIDQIFVDVGDRVEAGQPIVGVSTVELKLGLDQQRALYRQARTRLGLSEDSDDDLSKVTDAAEVKKAAADLKQADETYKRSNVLLEKQLVPAQDVEQAEARLNSAKAAYDLSIQTVQNLRAQLPQYRAAMELAEKKLRDAVIRAPFKGEVKERVVAPGQYVKVQTPVMGIVDIDPLRVRLKIPEKMSDVVRVGDTVSVSVEAYADKTFSGKVSRINPSVDQQSRTFDVEALLANSQGLLKPGFFIKARLGSGKLDQALVVPEDALSYAFGVYKAFLIQGKVVKETEVKVGDRTPDGMIEVISGLQAGDTIALAAKGQTLTDGAAIQIAD